MARKVGVRTMGTVYFKSVKSFAASCLRRSDYVYIHDADDRTNRVRAWDKRIGDAIGALRTFQTGTIECFDKYGRLFGICNFKVTQFGVIAVCLFADLAEPC